MNQFLERLEYPEYVHVLLNTLPVTGLFVALIFLVLSLIFRSRGAILISLTMIALLTLSAWPVFYFGEEAYERVTEMIEDEEGEQWLEYHKQMAERWVYLFFGTSILSAVGLLFGLITPRSLRLFVPLVLLGTIASVLVGAFLADFGGKIRHSEFRWEDPPEVPQPVSDSEDEEPPEEGAPPEAPETPEDGPAPESEDDPQSEAPSETPEGESEGAGSGEGAEDEGEGEENGR